MRIASFLSLLGLSIVLTGCTPWATYPPVEGAVELSEPTLEPIPTLMSKAIVFAREHYAPDHGLVINLPPDAPATAYLAVIKHLGGGRPMDLEDESAFHVRTVRVRGLDAEVELIYPRMGRVHELVTIRFKKKVLGEYAVTSTRLWRYEVEVPPPHYVPLDASEYDVRPQADETEYYELTGEYDTN